MIWEQECSCSAPGCEHLPSNHQQVPPLQSSLHNFLLHRQPDFSMDCRYWPILPDLRTMDWELWCYLFPWCVQKASMLLHRVCVLVSEQELFCWSSTSRSSGSYQASRLCFLEWMMKIQRSPPSWDPYFWGQLWCRSRTMGSRTPRDGCPAWTICWDSLRWSFLTC